MGRRIGPKTWDRIVEFFGDFWDSREPPENCCGLLCGISEFKFYVDRYETGNSYGNRFQKNWNRCRMSGLPVDSPLPLFWDCKNSPGFV